jgi:hypothetical protein
MKIVGYALELLGREHARLARKSAPTWQDLARIDDIKLAIAHLKEPTR